jgi:hypothetical protein
MDSIACCSRMRLLQQAISQSRQDDGLYLTNTAIATIPISDSNGLSPGSFPSSFRSGKPGQG